MQVNNNKMARAKKKTTAATKAAPYFASESNLNLIRACVEQNAPALLIGETGTGKTTIIREIAKEHDQTLIRISVNGSMGVEEILGKWLVEKGSTKWQDGVLTDALRKGHWVVMDEINAALPEILFTLHSLLDDDRKIVLPEKDNELVVPHKDFRFFATMNPPEEYAGTKDMNKALMSRFTAVLNVDVLSEANEVKLLESKGSDTDTAIRLVRVARVLRKEKADDNIYYYCSTRDLVQCANLVQAGLSLSDAFLGSIVNKMSREEYSSVQGKIEPELKKAVSLPTPTIDELILAVAEAEKRIEATKADLEAKHSREVADIKEKARKEAADEVSTDFVKKLQELAGK